MKPLLRSEHRAAPQAACDIAPRREPLEVRLPLVDAWLAAATALLAALCFTRAYGTVDRWCDPSTGHALPFVEALRRARKDVCGAVQLALAHAVVATELALLAADGWTEVRGTHGVAWRALGDPTHRSRREAVGIALTATLRAVPVVEGRTEGLREVVGAYLRRGDEGHGDEERDGVAQAHTPDEPALDGWMERPLGMEGRTQRVGMRSTGYAGVSGLHELDVAPDDEGGMCR